MVTKVPVKRSWETKENPAILKTKCFTTISQVLQYDRGAKNYHLGQRTIVPIRQNNKWRESAKVVRAVIASSRLERGILGKS